MKVVGAQGVIVIHHEKDVLGQVGKRLQLALVFIVLTEEGERIVDLLGVAC